MVVIRRRHQALSSLFAMGHASFVVVGVRTEEEEEACEAVLYSCAASAPYT